MCLLCFVLINSMFVFFKTFYVFVSCFGMLTVILVSKLFEFEIFSLKILAHQMDVSSLHEASVQH